MSLRSLEQNIYDLLETIEYCYSQKRLTVCLALLYIGIDATSSLEITSYKNTKDAFISWTQRYIINTGKILCTATDIYAARCGIVHSFAADSKLSSSQDAKKIFYAWETAKSEKLQTVIEITKENNIISIHMRDLIDAFRCGLADYYDEITSDSERLAVIEKATDNWFIYTDKTLIENYIERHSHL